MSVVTNWAVQLSGGTQAGFASDTTIGNSDTQFSVSFWAKHVGAVSGNATLMTNVGGSSFGWAVFSATGNVDFSVFFQDFSSDFVNSSVSIADGSWHNVVCVYDATVGVNLKVYIDGILRGTHNDPAPTSTNYNSGVAIQLGPAQNSNTVKMDDVRFYNTALTATDATNLAAGNEISTANRQSYWPLEEGSGNTTADTSGTGNNMTFTPSATWTTDTPVPPLMHSGPMLNLSDSVASADQLAKKVFRSLADTATPPTDALVKQPGKALMEPTLSVVDVQGKITARRLSESVETGDWNEQEKNPAQNVWTDF